MGFGVHFVPWASSDYRPDIDGLRAIAVLATMSFHVFPEWMPSGYLGVDMFFVISGYVITRGIRRDLVEGRFQLSHFYMRRVRRIFPAAILVLSVTLIFGAISLYPDEYRRLGIHATAAAGFFANGIFWSEIGYFDAAAQSKHLLHFWSLAVEEQFYLVWPVMAVLLWRHSSSPVCVTWGIALISFILYFWSLYWDPGTAFYGPHCRFWELAVGCALAFSASSTSEAGVSMIRGSGWQSELLAFVGMAILVTSFWPGTPASQATHTSVQDLLSFQAWRVPIAVLGVGLLLFGDGKTYLHKLMLAQPFLVGFGLISFPLYLWHWPLLVASRLRHEDGLPLPDRFFVIGLSVLLAWLTFRFLEAPIRRRLAGPKLVGALVVSMLAIGAVSAAVWWQDGFPARLPNAAAARERFSDWDFPDAAYRKESLHGVAVVRIGGEGRQTLFLGDSAVEQYGPRISHLLANNRGATRGAIFMTQGGQFPIDGVRRSDNQISRWKGLTELLEDPRIDRIVVGAAWPLYMNAEKRDLGMNPDLAPRFFIGATPLDDPTATPEVRRRLIEQIHLLRGNSRVVYLVSSIPVGPEIGDTSSSGPRPLILQDLPVASNDAIDRGLVEQRLGRVRSLLREVSIATGSVWIDPLDTLCDSQACPIAYFKDIGHLRASFVRKEVRFLDQSVVD